MAETALKEAVTEESTGETKPARRLRLPWPRRERAAETVSPAETPSEPRVESPLAYRTFSPKIAPALSAAGGILAVLGGLGAWVRATQVETEGLDAELVTLTMGYDDPEGLTLATLGAILVVASLLWIRRRPIFNLIPAPVLKVVPLLLSLGIIVLAAWQLPEIDQEARELAAQAIEQLGFVSYHAGFGWGAWCMLVAALTVFLGSAVGILRELDLRRAATQERGTSG